MSKYSLEKIEGKWYNSEGEQTTRVDHVKDLLADGTWHNLRGFYKTVYYLRKLGFDIQTAGTRRDRQYRLNIEHPDYFMKDNRSTIIREEIKFGFTVIGISVLCVVGVSLLLSML